LLSLLDQCENKWKLSLKLQPLIHGLQIVYISRNKGWNHLSDFHRIKGKTIFNNSDLYTLQNNERLKIVIKQEMPQNKVGNVNHNKIGDEFNKKCTSAQYTIQTFSNLFRYIFKQVISPGYLFLFSSKH